MRRLIAMLLIIGQCAYANECKVPQETDTPCIGVLLPPSLALTGLNCIETQDKTKERLQLDVEFQKERVDSCEVRSEYTTEAFDNALAHNKTLFDKSFATILALDKPTPWWKSDEAFFWYGFASGVAVTVGGAWAVTQVKDAL